MEDTLITQIRVPTGSVLHQIVSSYPGLLISEPDYLHLGITWDLWHMGY